MLYFAYDQTHLLVVYGIEVNGNAYQKYLNRLVV